MSFVVVGRFTPMSAWRSSTELTHIKIDCFYTDCKTANCNLVERESGAGQGVWVRVRKRLNPSREFQGGQDSHSSSLVLSYLESVVDFSQASVFAFIIESDDKH